MALGLFGMGGMESLFAVTAVLGSVLFVVRLILMLMGGFADADAELDVDGDVGDAGFDADGDVGDADVDGDVGDAEVDAEGRVSSSDTSFRLLTLQGITAFFMMFGLVGLALLKQNKVAEGWAFVGGVIAGLIAVWVISKIFSMMKRLQSSGTIRLANAVGLDGTIYLTIPESGTGKAQLTVQGRLGIYNAVSESGEAINTGERIRVVRIVSGNLLMVRKLDAENSGDEKNSGSAG